VILILFNQSPNVSLLNNRVSIDEILKARILPTTAQSFLIFLRLSPIKAALGQKQWLQKKKTVREIAIREVGSLLTRQDAYCFHGDELCIVALAATTEPGAQLLATTISAKIVTSLFGVNGPREIALDAHILATDEVFDLSSFGIPMETGGPTDDDGDKDTNIVTPFQQPPNERTDPAKPGPDQRDAVRSARRKELLQMFGEVTPTDVFFEYRPIWDVKNRMVDTFRCVPCFESDLHGKISGYRTIETIGSGTDTLELDVDCLETGLIDLKHALDNRNPVSLRLGVHFETLASNRGRSEMIKILPAIPQLIRERLEFVLFGAPQGIPEIRLQEILGFLMPYARDAMLVLDPQIFVGHKLTNLLAKMCAMGLGSMCVVVPTECDEKTFETIGHAVARIDSFGLKTHAMGVTSGAQITRLATLGAISFDGPVFGGPFRLLPPAYPVDASQLEHMDQQVRVFG
jgi:hypothetical protein